MSRKIKNNKVKSIICRRCINALTVILFAWLLTSCSKTENGNKEPKLIIKLVTDSDQMRLGNTGTPAIIPPGHAGQSPSFNLISAHYLEFAPDAFTPLGKGVVLYHASETSEGGATAIDFGQAIVKKPGEIFLEIPLKNLVPGTYEWVRLSLAYQNYDVQFYFGGKPYSGTLASFVGYNTFINNYKIKSQTVEVHANKLQGYWGFESIGGITTGQSPAGATTVPNPLFLSSPIPSGSCVVTGKFQNSLIITGKETHDVTIDMSLSVNNSFEWKDTNGNGKWDVDVNAIEEVVDMGLRGLIPIVR